ncbi:MAG: hypothetical protein GX433_00685 [Deltaproteobacteria bacterium]|nr:hypothetical protein [Deltaproteobacteria bacterium]
MADHLGVEVVHHDLGLLADGVIVGCHIATQVAGVFGMADSDEDLGELLDGVADLLVEHPPEGWTVPQNRSRCDERTAGRS